MMWYRLGDASVLDFMPTPSPTRSMSNSRMELTLIVSNSKMELETLAEIFLVIINSCSAFNNLAIICCLSIILLNHISDRSPILTFIYSLSLPYSIYSPHHKSYHISDHLSLLTFITLLIFIYPPVSYNNYVVT